jgi:hypothetical protein
LKRPIDADPEVKKIIEDFFMGYHSIVQRVRNSMEFRAMSKEYATADPLDPLESNDVDSASNAKHRFDSVFRSVVRFIKLLDSYLGTARKVAILRRGEDEGKDAETFLSLLHSRAGVRRLLIIGLLGECC